MAIITGARNFINRLARMRGSKKNSQIVAALYSIGQRIELDAEISITAGSVSGAGHEPSLPGQPPNADTRHLDTNIETLIIARYPPTVTVESHAEYSAALEYGTEHMEERPFMRPALEKNRALIAKGVQSAIRKSK